MGSLFFASDPSFVAQRFTIFVVIEKFAISFVTSKQLSLANESV